MKGISIVSEQTKTIVRATKNGKKAGLSKEKIIENLLKFENISDANEVVEQIYEKSISEDFEESPIEQLEYFINNNYSLRLNEVTGYIENGDRRMTENDLNGIFISAKKQIPKIDFQLMMRLLKSEFVPHYNPFFEFFGSDGIAPILDAMPEKDQNSRFETPLISKLASSIINDNPFYTEYFLRKWIVGIISAMHKVHSPLLFCLLGKKQGTGKTEFFRRLLPKELNHYYAESKLDKEKDDEILMTEKILIMDDELGGKSKSDNLKLKNITSKQWFSLRRPYGSQNETILRLAVLAGTSNYLEVLSDSSGNRRIIPVEVIAIDKHIYNSIDKKELFMEAYKVFKDGFDWRITEHDIEFLNKDEVKYEAPNIERDLMMRYFRVPTEQELENKEYQTLSTIDIKVALEYSSRQKISANGLGRIIGNLGYKQKTVRIGNQTPKMWMVVKLFVEQQTSLNNNGNQDVSNFFVNPPSEEMPSEQGF